MLDSKTLTMIGILVGVFAVGLYLYKKFKDEQKRQKLEPMFIREVTNGKKPQQFSGQIIPVSKSGSSYSWSTWINVTDYDYKRKEWKHIMHKGDRLGTNCQPGIWITPDMNNLVIRVATSAGGPLFTKKIGAPQYFMEMLTSRGPPNDPRVEMISNVSSPGEKVLSKTYKEIVKEHSDAKEIIAFVQGDKLDDHTTPVIYFVVKDDKLINSGKNIMPPSQLKNFIPPGANLFTIRRSKGKSNLNPSMADIENDGIGCVVENFALNRWIHIVVVTYERSFDVFIDGKLYRSIPLNGYLKDNGGDLFTCQKGGFGGAITQLRVFDRPISVGHVDFLYKCGPACPMLPDINAWLESVKPKFKVNFDIDIDIDVGAEAEVEEDELPEPTDSALENQ